MSLAEFIVFVAIGANISALLEAERKSAAKPKKERA